MNERAFSNPQVHPQRSAWEQSGGADEKARSDIAAAQAQAAAMAVTIAGLSSAADPGDLTLIFDNKLI